MAPEAFSPPQDLGTPGPVEHQPAGSQPPVLTPHHSPVGSLYVHVPFCVHKCLYCAFYSAEATPMDLDRYAEALCREMEMVSADLRPRTVYFGGGTPTLLEMKHWTLIHQTMARLGWVQAPEWTVECNPATLSPAKAAQLREIGINRVSMGIQSLDDALLDRLGRVHSRQQVFQAYDWLRAAGFDNLNLDLMFAIPGQSLASWQQTLDEVMAMGSEHLSCYEVTYEEDTPLYAQMAAGAAAVDEDLACDMYEELLEACTRAGFWQYEISNFARHKTSGPADLPSQACLHNVNYWRGGSFYGLGPSATSYRDGRRTKNLSDTARYCDELAQGRRPCESQETLSALVRAGETAAFGLRMTLGWPFKDFFEATGFDLRLEWAAEIAQMIKLGFGWQNDTRFWLTPAGLRHADWVAEQFIRITDSSFA